MSLKHEGSFILTLIFILRGCRTLTSKVKIMKPYENQGSVNYGQYLFL